MGLTSTRENIHCVLLGHSHSMVAKSKGILQTQKVEMASFLKPRPGNWHCVTSALFC